MTRVPSPPLKAFGVSPILMDFPFLDVSPATRTNPWPRRPQRERTPEVARSPPTKEAVLTRSRSRRPQRWRAIWKSRPCGQHRNRHLKTGQKVPKKFLKSSSPSRTRAFRNSSGTPQGILGRSRLRWSEGGVRCVRWLWSRSPQFLGQRAVARRQSSRNWLKRAGLHLTCT